MTIAGYRISLWTLVLFAIVLLALGLRLKGIHNPILDHPGWRQGDEASIARNFATLQYNILYPQTNYNGPPPNYVELELQIVPFLAATLYKLFGVHEIFGRLITAAFSLGTVALLGLFARWLFFSEIAGLAAALLYAIMPGSIYYGRTFTPDAAMVFFLTAALYACSRLLVQAEVMTPRALLRCTALLLLAYLAKPVALVALVPISAMMTVRIARGRTVNWYALATLLIVPFAVLYAYDRAVASHAEWLWASGITKLHVLPALHAALTNGAAFSLKFAQFRQVLGMLTWTMLGPFCTALAILGLVVRPPNRSRTLLWGWLAAGLLYTYVVVTVERVDYYMFLLLPLAALLGAAFIAQVADRIIASRLPISARYVISVACAIVFGLALWQNRAIIRPYYAYSKPVYRNAIALNRTLDPSALIVMGH
ncbi:MAG: glycosyltransferase family 39 protein, partial [Candidatus Eremiobacteraeota bacterium]|nr:glycosyltransferase family 39 protein [Candidatus Eremiobacteraeota bacterium]